VVHAVSSVKAFAEDFVRFAPIETGRIPQLISNARRKALQSNEVLAIVERFARELEATLRKILRRPRPHEQARGQQAHVVQQTFKLQTSNFRLQTSDFRLRR
jgi:hypothetical protein